MQSGGFEIMSFMPLILIFVVMYFLIIRPQNKKAKAHQAMLAAIKAGDRVVTNGGLIGVVESVSETEMSVELCDNVIVQVSRSMIANVLPPVEKKKQPAKKKVAAKKVAKTATKTTVKKTASKPKSS